MNRGVLVWWLLVGGWLVAIGSGVFGVLVPAYEEVVARRLADRILAETASTLESISADAVIRHELAVPETLAGASYQLGINGTEVYLTAPQRDIDTAVPLHGPETVTYDDSQCRSEDGVRVLVQPAANTTTVSLCGDR